MERLPDPLRADELWQKVKTDLSGCLEDRAHLDRILAGKRKPSILQPRSAPRMDDKVLVDEEASDFYTIVEVYTWDRPGVLHAITDTLFRLDISIQLAKISTPGAQVADVFYVTDLSGNKLLDYDASTKKFAKNCWSACPSPDPVIIFLSLSRSRCVPVRANITILYGSHIVLAITSNLL